MDQAIFSMALSDVSPDSICLIAENETEALDLLTVTRVKPHLIFAEYNLPGFDAFRFMRTLRLFTSLSQIPVILHCSEAEINGVIKKTGANAFYSREYSVDGIRNLLYLYLPNEISAILLN